MSRNSRNYCDKAGWSNWHNNPQNSDVFFIMILPLIRQILSHFTLNFNTDFENRYIVYFICHNKIELFGDFTLPNYTIILSIKGRILFCMVLKVHTGK